MTTEPTEEPNPFDLEAWRKEPGPWQGEPDRKEWRHAGFACLIVRSRFGSLCGYVGTPPGHPWHGKSYRELEEHPDYPDCHGGITYSGSCSGEIHHTPTEGEPEVWWQGFDCNHSDDIAPGLLAFERFMCAHNPVFAKLTKMIAESPYGSRRQYRDIAYVTHEVEQLAEQAAVMGVLGAPDEA